MRQRSGNRQHQRVFVVVVVVVQVTQRQLRKELRLPELL